MTTQTNALVPRGYTSLAKYVADHPSQTEDVVSTIQACTVAVLDTVEGALRNRPGADRDAAYDAIRDLQQAYRKIIPVGIERSVAQNATSKAMHESFAKTASADVHGQQVSLEAPHQETSTEGLIHPAGADVQAVFKGREGEHVTKAVATYSESADVPYDTAPAYPNRGVVDRPGVQQAVAILEGLSPLVRSLLIEPQVSPSTISSSQEASRQSLSVEHSTKASYLFRTDRTDRTDFAQDSVSHTTGHPALVQAIQGLDALRDLVDTMRSVPAKVYPVTVQRSMSEVVDTAWEVTIPRVLRHDVVETRHSTNQRVNFTNGKSYVETSTPVGSIEYSPAYLTMEAQS